MEGYFFTEIYVEISLDCALPTIRGQITLT